MRRRSES